MTRLIAAFLFVAVLCGPIAARAEAPPPPRDEAALRLSLAHRFIDAIQADQMAATMNQTMSSMMPRRPDLTQAQNDAIHHAMSTAMGQMMTDIFDAMAPVYADIFTLEELTGLVAFYESDIGRSLMTKSYAAAPRITQIVQGMMPRVMRQMADTLCDEMNCTAEEKAQMNASIAAAGYGGGPAAVAPPTKGN